MNEKKLKIAFIFLLVVSLSLLIFQIKSFYDVHRELTEKTEKLENLKAVKNKITGIEQELVKERLVEEAMFTKIPEGKESIFDLMRELTVISDNTLSRNIYFSIKDDPEDEKSDEEVFKGKKGDLQIVLGGNVDDHYFEMGFESKFIDSTVFLEKLLNIDRIVLIQSLKIERDEDILPRQRIKLNLVTYTFSIFQ